MVDGQRQLLYLGRVDHQVCVCVCACVRAGWLDVCVSVFEAPVDASVCLRIVYKLVHDLIMILNKYKYMYIYYTTQVKINGHRIELGEVRD